MLLKKHLFCVATALTALSCTQHGGRNFLESRTGIDVTEAPVCGAGVADFERCRPIPMGGAPWEHAASFPPYSLPRFSRGASVERLMSGVRAHYLGSPYYAGDVHAICKDGVDERIFPEGATNLQEYDLAEVIEDRAVKPVANRVRSILQERESPDASVIARRFESHLITEVHDRVKARVLWFVTRYPGGLADLSRERQLRKCLQESHDRNAQVVTGVAGYMVMDNKVDSAIGSREVVYRALDLALRNRTDEVHLEPEFRHSIANEWQGRVSEVAHIKFARNDVTATAWPLWVQFQ
jgi:hypothetical protein